jgi:hypothetical protein
MGVRVQSRARLLRKQETWTDVIVGTSALLSSWRIVW